MSLSNRKWIAPNISGFDHAPEVYQPAKDIEQLLKGLVLTLPTEAAYSTGLAAIHQVQAIERYVRELQTRIYHMQQVIDTATPEEKETVLYQWIVGTIKIAVNQSSS